MLFVQVLYMLYGYMMSHSWALKGTVQRLQSHLSFTAHVIFLGRKKIMSFIVDVMNTRDKD